LVKNQNVGLKSKFWL